MGEHTAENDAPACRSCYAATLTPDERDRFNAEPVTSCVYLCPEHAEAIDKATRGFLSSMFDRRIIPHGEPVDGDEGGALKTPDEWCAELGARVVDPDGWRDGTRDWSEPITREEFDRRLRICTVDGRGYPDFLGGAR